MGEGINAKIAYGICGVMTGGPRKAGCRWILSQVLSMVIMDVDNHDVI